MNENRVLCSCTESTPTKRVAIASSSVVSEEESTVHALFANLNEYNLVSKMKYCLIIFIATITSQRYNRNIPSLWVTALVLIFIMSIRYLSSSLGYAYLTVRPGVPSPAGKYDMTCLRRPSTLVASNAGAGSRLASGRVRSLTIVSCKVSMSCARDGVYNRSETLLSVSRGSWILGSSLGVNSRGLCGGVWKTSSLVSMKDCLSASTSSITNDRFSVCHTPLLTRWYLRSSSLELTLLFNP